jgi:hypothetical protein
LLFGAVMKRTALALTLIVGFVLLIVSVQRVSLIKANPYFFKDNYCDVSIHSPQNMTYGTGNIILDFTVKTIDYVPPSYDYFYSLDGQDFQSSVKIEDVQIVSEEEITNESIVPYIDTTLKGRAELHFLSNGTHSVKVFSGHFINGKIHYITSDPYSATADFIVNSATVSSSPEPTLFPTNYTGGGLSETEIIIGTAVTVIVILVGLGLLVYLIKRK